MGDYYALEWFDRTITVSLNPQKSNIDEITVQQAQDIILKAGEEREKLQSLLKHQVFKLRKESRIGLLIKQYHTALIILLDEVFKNQKLGSRNPASKRIFKEIIDCLDGFLSFIEVRFSAYLSLNERVPVTYFLITMKELKFRFDKLKNGCPDLTDDNGLMDIIFGTFSSFIGKPKDDPVNFREVFYYRELMTELEKLKMAGQDSDILMELNEVLIYMNFHDLAYMSYFTKRIAGKINGHASLNDKKEQLLF